MKVAVIGYGRWGRVVAGKLAAMPEADLVAVVDAEFGSLAMAHELHGVATYGSTAEMLDEHEPHLCCVTVPPQHHARVALECLAGGAHVWVTKPMAMSNVEAQAIMAGADAAERLVAVDHTLLWEPSVVTAVEIIERGEIGQLLEVHSTRRQAGPARPEGVIWDLMPHDLAVALRLAHGPGPDMSGSTVYADQRTYAGRVYQARLTLEIEDDGPTVFLHAHALWPTRERGMWLIGDMGALHINERGLFIHEAERTFTPGVRLDGPHIAVDTGHWDALEAQLVEVIRWTAAGDGSAEHRATGWHGLVVTDVLEASANAAMEYENTEAA